MNGMVKNQTTPYHLLQPAIASLEFKTFKTWKKQLITTRNRKQI
jgi:hypothetical protein